MYRSGICFVLIMILLLAGSRVSPAEDAKVLTATTLPNFAPHAFEIPDTGHILSETIEPGTHSQRIQGYAWDIFRESLHAMGYTIILEVMPWKRCLKMVEGGHIDLLFPASWNKEREQIYDYSKAHINLATYVVFYLDERQAAQWQGLGSLKGKKVLKMRGWTYGSEFDTSTEFHTHEINRIEQALGMLAQGRADAFAGYRLVHGYQFEKIGKAGQVFATEPFGFSKEFVLTQKGSKRGNELLKVFAAGKQALEANGRLMEIGKKWTVAD
jgi:polar amino acid transport system substrate-binding protein